MVNPVKWLAVIAGAALVAGVAVVGVRLVGQATTRPQETVPSEYRSLVLAAATRCPALPPSVLAAQIATESGWNPRAESGAGAQGIAQFIPQTWQDYGVDANRDGRADVYDPADAIPSAASFMCRLMDEVDSVPGNRVTLALAAYNAGPNQVRRYGGIPPFPETEQYVQRIRTRAATEPFASLDRGRA